jgi:hypothetical protein
MTADYSSISSSSNPSLISFDKSFALLRMGADLKKGANSNIYRAVMAAVEQEEERTKQYLANDPEWSEVANNLSVSVSEKGGFDYKFSGSPDQIARVKELEYGGPSAAAKGTIRKLKFSSAKKVESAIDSALGRFLK